MTTSATNLDLPFDSTPPPGVTPGVGISVNAVFTSPTGQIFTQPAFYYQDFTDPNQSGNFREGRDWIYPTGSFSWKVRFTPNGDGIWQYKLIAQDASGSVESPTFSFTVVASSNHGFIQVSKKDPRYFEFNDGTYFPGMGYNMNWDQVHWENPVSGNAANFQKISQDGVQLIRIWLSQWSIFGSQDNTWQSVVPWDYGVPTSVSLTNNSADVYPGSDVSMFLNWNSDPCMSMGIWKGTPAVKPNTLYHISIRYLIPQALAGPAIAGQPYGFVAKFGGWLTTSKTNPADNWTPGLECAYPAALANQYNSEFNVKPITSYVNAATNGWVTLEADFSTDYNTTYAKNYLPDLYLALENVTGNNVSAYIDRVDIRENLGNGQYGPNIVQKPWMSQDQYFTQKDSYGFDKVLDLAKQNGIYFKLVVLEKNEFILNSFDYSGNPVGYDSSNKYFYGNSGNMTKVYWLQRAWWRYLQARWGYSPNIHSWELNNEGDPWSNLHYALAENFAVYMHQFTPDVHLTTTSMWNSFPISPFWRNLKYSDLDYADVHIYTEENRTINLTISDGSTSTVPLFVPNDFYDTASDAQKPSMILGAKQLHGVGKPVIGGEGGFLDANGNPNTYFNSDTGGIWLHNYIWGQINPGGLIDSYWFDTEHIYSGSFDHRTLYGQFYQFISRIPLNNGNYVDAAAVATDGDVRVWGQKDLVNNNAHMWIQNKKHTWCAAVGGVSGCPNSWDNSRLNGTVTVSGFSPNTSFPVEWWNFDNSVNLTKSTGSVTSNSSGQIVLDLSQLPSTVTDTGVKIGRYQVATPAPSHVPSGDLNGDGKIDTADLRVLFSRYLTAESGADLKQDGIVNLLDAGILISNLGQ